MDRKKLTYALCTLLLAGSVIYFMSMSHPAPAPIARPASVTSRGLHGPKPKPATSPAQPPPPSMPSSGEMAG
jgi:hypothetical protein